jgi:hypothetical protein
MAAYVAASFYPAGYKAKLLRLAGTFIYFICNTIFTSVSVHVITPFEPLMPGYPEKPQWLGDGSALTASLGETIGMKHVAALFPAAGCLCSLMSHRQDNFYYVNHNILCLEGKITARNSAHFPKSAL